MELQSANYEPQSLKLSGKSFVISGVLQRHSRDELKQIIEMNGGKNSETVSSKTDFLIAGSGIGPSKLHKAQSFNIKIISEEDFEQLLKNS
jgi:DNA ligase (NAD+)